MLGNVLVLDFVILQPSLWLMFQLRLALLFGVFLAI